MRVHVPDADGDTDEFVAPHHPPVVDPLVDGLEHAYPAEVQTTGKRPRSEPLPGASSPLCSAGLRELCTQAEAPAHHARPRRELPFAAAPPALPAATTESRVADSIAAIAVAGA